MSSQLDKIIRTYRNIAQIPALIGAKLSNDGRYVTSVWSQRCLERGKNIKYTRQHFVNENLSKIAETVPVDISQELISATSPTEKYRALIREIPEAKEARKQFLEIWSKHNLIHSVDLTSLDVHGDVYADGEFGTLEWNFDETKLLYLAEKKPPTAEPFYKQKKKNNKRNESDKDEIVKGAEHVYKQDWGEQLVGKAQSAIVVFDLKTEDIKLLDGVPANVCPAQVRWNPKKNHVIGVAYFTEYRKLGLIYCSNRLSTIFKLDLDGNYNSLNLENVSVKSPRYVNNQEDIIWLQRTAGGPHHACMKLMYLTGGFENHVQKVVVPIVDEETKTKNDVPFYGLYNTGFARNCWINNRLLALSTNQKNSICSYIVDILTGDIIDISFANGSLIILDVKNDTILANRRNYFNSDELVVGKVSKSEYIDQCSVKWTNLTESVSLDDLNDENYKFEYLNLMQPNDDSVKSFSAIYIAPRFASKDVPLIVWPHGGPHSAFVNCMALETSLYCLSGFALLMINYRGSIGAGQTSVDFLPGRIGTADVSDCILAVDTVLNKYSYINPKKLALVGGSHGGFLVTHLSGQHPEKFRCVVARNPVIDIASMSIISDIPDWCFVEAGTEYTQVGKPKDELLLAMRNSSPIMHAHKVKAPTLLQIGSKDLRVPPHQGLEYYHRLKANGIEVQMNLYEDNHPLGNTPNEIDNCINGLLWIQQHINN